MVLGCTSSSEIINEINNNNSSLPLTFVSATDNQTLVNEEETFIIFQYEFQDDNNWHSENSSDVTVDSDGDYFVSVNLGFAPHSSPHTMDVEYIIILYADSTPIDYHVHVYDGSGFPDYIDLTGVYRLNAGESISVGVTCLDTAPPTYDGQTLVTYLVPFLEVKRLW